MEARPQFDPFNSSPLSDQQLLASINTVRVYHRGVNPPGNKRMKYAPITLDYNGQSYTFFPEGVRWKKVRKRRAAEYLDLNGDKVTGSEVWVTEWVPDHAAVPVESGQNGVDVPVEAYRYWRTRGSYSKLFEEHERDADGNMTGNVRQLLQTEIQVAQSVRDERDALALQRDNLAQRVRDLEEEKARIERESARARELVAKAALTSPSSADQA